MMRFVFLISNIIFLFGCQTQPTRVVEQNEVAVKEKRIELQEGTVVLDARPSFEYSLLHISESISIQWQDFAQKEEAFKGLLDKDLYFHARRLARYGIGLDTPVVVVGRGLQGDGEEGRLAWTLKLMGVKNIRFTSIDSFNLPLTRNEPSGRKNAPIWRPQIDETLVVDKREFLAVATKIGSFSQGNISERDTVIIDVRPESDYVGKGSGYISKNAPDIGAINIPWKEFLNQYGEANVNIVEKLKSVGILPQHKIFLIDDKGVRSAMVTLILRDLGYSKASNFSGGYQQLLLSK